MREHIAPLMFALTALTSLLLLQYVTKQLDKLVGKGLPWSVIGEFLLLSLPFTVAMTLPMAVLVSTLHAFGRLASEHEVTAFRASGVRVRSLMAPVLLASLILSAGMLVFNDQVLPRANHRLSGLLGDIINVRPTLALREQVLTKVTDTFYMKVGWLDQTSNRMRDVIIYDVENTAERSTIYADSGTFTQAPGGRDLQLVLYDGEQLQFPDGDAKQLQRTVFREQLLRVPNMSRQYSASGSSEYKGDREQGICELQQEYVRRAEEYEARRQQYIGQLSALAADGQETITVPRPRPAHKGLAHLYCNGLAAVFRVKTAQAAPAPPAVLAALPATTTATATVAQDATYTEPDIDSIPADVGALSAAATNFQVTPASLQDALTNMSQIAVEVQKKFALSLACFVFVLFGPPIALRFPRGGVGVTLGVSLVVFGAYYVCLMAGETLADNGRVDPVIAMWAANVIFTVAGLVLLWRVENTDDASRGGGIRAWWTDRRARKRLRAEGALTARGASV